MAIENIFAEIDRILDSHNRHDAITSQSLTYVTEVYYTEQWTKGVFHDVIEQKLGDDIQLTPSQSAQVTAAAARIFRNQTSVSKWEGYLLRAGFTILEGKLDSDGDPDDYDPNLPNQVYVADLPGGGVKVRFYRSYTAESGIGEPHGAAQREYMINYAQTLAEELHSRGFAHSRGLGRTSRDYSDPEAKEQFVPDSRESYRRATAYKGFRLHGSTGRHTGAGEKSHSTVALLDFLDKASQTLPSTAGTSMSDLNFITQKLNKRLNAAYSIEGLDKIDLFKEQDISKSVVIKIIFGTAAQNTLMREADRGSALSSNPSIDRLLASIRDDFMDQWGKDPSKKGSKSVAELNALGAFAHIPKEMRTASGLPDMRFKLNKQTMKLAKLVEKSKGKKGKTIVKGSKKTIKRNTVNSTKSLKAGRAGRRVPENDASLVRLMGHINNALPRHLKGNMEPPALQYRGRAKPSKPFAGPFNRGVRATAVRPDPKQTYGDGIIVDYTYEKYPYQTFEPGFLKGDVMRDPRKLIQESIRDVLIERRITRFLTMRRV